MSLLGECRDINGVAVKHGLMYMAGPGECHQCVCESGVPKNCQDVMCHQPQNCSTFRKGARCCDFVCLDDIAPGKADVVGFEGDFGLRLIASVITAVLSFSLLFFLVHRLRQRKIRTGRQNRQLSEDERSLGSIGYITGSLGYLPGAMERYEEPTTHFPHYPLWKPPGNYFPRGEAPPPYEEAVAATRAEALAVAMSGGNMHSNGSNFGREALLGVNYSTYTSGNLIGGAAHRTIPINLATSASFTLQPDHFDENAPNGGGSCVSVSTGTVSVTATVTAPQTSRPDLLNTDVAHVRQDSSTTPSTVRRSDNARGHQADASLRLNNSLGGEYQQADITHTAEGVRNSGNLRGEIPLRTEGTHRKEFPLNQNQSETNDCSNTRSELPYRLDFSLRDTGHRENLRRQDASISINYQRGDERRLPSVPLPEVSRSLPPQHSHGVHHPISSGGLHHHQQANIHSHSFGRQQHVGMPLIEMPPSILQQDFEQKDRKLGASKMVIPHLTTVPKSGTGVYEDSFHPLSVDSPQTATLRRGKHHSVISNGMITLRRNPVPVATPTISSPKQVPSLSTNTLSSGAVTVVASVLNAPSSGVSPVDHSQNSTPTLITSPPTAIGASVVVASPPNCSYSKVETLRCTCPGSCHSSILSLAVNDSSVPQNSNLSLTQAGLDDNDDYRSECENCKSTHSSNYYLDAEDPEPEITMTLHRKPAETGEENGNAYYRASLTLPTRHRPVPLHGVGARDNWFSSMPEYSSDDESDEE